MNRHPTKQGKTPHPLIQHLRRARLRAGLTGYQVAERLHISNATLYSREGGKYEPVCLADVDRWAAVFGLRLALVPLACEERLGEAS